MGLELLSMTVFWTWHLLQPAPTLSVTKPVNPTKVILQATWLEPVALQDKSSRPLLREVAATKKLSQAGKRSITTLTQKTQKPLWKAAKSWEFPPILWAGFEGFLAAGLGIVSLLKT